MIANFGLALEYLAEYEGGLVDHPKDPGGRTNRGVTQAVYDAWRRLHGLPPRLVDHLTDKEHDAIYQRQYWDLARCDLLFHGLDLAVFDFAVNSGVGRAVRRLQGIVGVKADGHVGVMTLQAITAYTNRHGEEALIRRYCEDRMAFLRGLPGFSTFGVGWTKRVEGKTPGVQIEDRGVVDRAIRRNREAKGTLKNGSGAPKSAPAATTPRENPTSSSTPAPTGALAAFLALLARLIRRESDD